MNIEMAHTGHKVNPGRPKEVLQLGAEGIFRPFNVDKIIREKSDFIILQCNVGMLIGKRA